ncbi:MAG TPA: CBS domain-containing protein [Chloroflexota bacterium]
MKVAELMMTPPVALPRDAPVSHAARLMLDNHLSGIPVVNNDGSIAGIITDSDLVTKHAHVHVPIYLGILGGVIPIETRRQDEEIRRALAVTAQDIMDEKYSTISPEADIDDAATLMVEHDADPIAVVDHGRLVGTISRADIIRLLVVEEADDDSTAG